MMYHDGTQNFMIEKYGVLAFKWRVVNIFCIPRSKVISKNKRVMVKLTELYILQGEAVLRMYESKGVGRRRCIPNCVLALSNPVLYNQCIHLDDVRGFLFFFSTDFDWFCKTYPSCVDSLRLPVRSIGKRNSMFFAPSPPPPLLFKLFSMTTILWSVK